MKRKTKKSNRILPVLLVIAGLFAVAGIVFACFKIFKLEKLFNNNEQIAPASQTHPNPIEAKKEIQPTSPQAAEPTFEEKKPIVQYSGEDPNVAEELSGAITYTGTSGDTLIIRVNIDQFITDGICTLNLTGSNTSYVEAARVIDAASTSTCEGFNVPLSLINDKNVQISIEVKSDGKQGTITGHATL